MNQFVIEMSASHTSLRSGYPISGDARQSAGARTGPVRPAWPFLVNSSAQADKQALQQESGNPAGFAS